MTTRAAFFRQRLLECVPAALLLLALATPLVAWAVSPGLAYLGLCGYLVYWAFRSVGIALRQAYEFRRMRRYAGIDWRSRLQALNDPYARLEELTDKPRLTRTEQEERAGLLNWVRSGPDAPSVDELWHLVVIPITDEADEILEQSLDAILDTGYPAHRLAVCVSFEERTGAWDSERIARVENAYQHRFGLFRTTGHPDGLPGEGRVKGANITWAAKQARSALHELGVADSQVVVSAFDCDTRASAHYFDVLSWTYLTDPGRDVNSYQPILLFHNNVWQVPAPSRLVGYVASMWTMVDSTRGRSRLRIFSSHALGMQALVAVDYWSTGVIPDDSRQYWRMYYGTDGRAATLPLHTPVYLDAVHASSYWQSLTEQYRQIRRWSYGVIDFPYIMGQNASNDRIGTGAKVLQTYRQLSAFHQWAMTPVMLMLARWAVGRLEPEVVPGSDNLLVRLLDHFYTLSPWITVASMVLGMLVALALLPPRPPNRSRYGILKLAAEWVLLPVVVPIFLCLPAIEAQVRLAGRRYLGFRVTTKTRLAPAHPLKD